MSHTLCGKLNYHIPTSLTQDILYVEVLRKVKSVLITEELTLIHNHIQKVDIGE